MYYAFSLPGIHVLVLCLGVYRGRLYIIMPPLSYYKTSLTQCMRFVRLGRSTVIVFCMLFHSVEGWMLSLSLSLSLSPFKIKYHLRNIKTKQEYSKKDILFFSIHLLSDYFSITICYNIKLLFVFLFIFIPSDYLYYLFIYPKKYLHFFIYLLSMVLCIL